MRWDQGSAVTDRMLADTELQRVPASRDQADRLIAQAKTHASSAAAICEEDPPGAYALVYDAARKALTAVLENQGLRPTTRGGHLAAYEAVRAQLDPPLGKLLRPFDRMRRQRHDAEYPPASVPELTAEDVREDIPKATNIINLSERVLDQMSPFR
ncbi:MAG TPA: HEPN domain-containing protein [Streptosporangiaceae bacterium]|nr:HEPN domain-containing protein [Streptosporangiaceae bacterium]